MATEREPLMSVAEVAHRLNVSRRTVRRLFERHELRGVRIGGQWRARPEDVERLATPADVPPSVAMRRGMSHPAASAPMPSRRPSWEIEGREKRLSAVTKSR